MIYNFPTPYPDELLYSICARYSDRMQYPLGAAVSSDLFGQRRNAKVGLPNSLEMLIANLPHEYNYTVTDLINKHTLLPFYGPFLPPNRLYLLKEKMKADKSKSISLLVDTRHRTWQSTCTRFCLRCVEEDRRQYGECYWHRVHQIPYVEVCPHHGTYIYDAALYTDYPIRSQLYFSSEKIIPQISHFLPRVGANENCEVRSIADDVFWLLQNHPCEDLSTMQKRYSILLVNHGLAAYGGSVNTSKLQQAFQQYYGGTLLKHFHAELRQSTHSNWLSRLPHNKEMRFFHPILHMLLIHFMGYKLEAFLTLPIEKKPFGSGPWPCLNPTCDHYREKCINNCEVLNWWGRSRKPRGKFSCDCGFTYSRIGPDSSDADCFRASPVKIYGPLWEAKLRELWLNPAVSVKQAARELGVAPQTVRKQAQKLGLSHFRHSVQNTVLSTTQNNYCVHPVAAPDPEVLEKYRAIWLAVREEPPNAGSGQIQSKFPNVYGWLVAHDREWLKAHTLTFVRKSCPPHPYINWEQRDAQISLEVKSSALSIKNAPGLPIKLTIGRIIGNMSQKRIIKYNLHRLPLTAQVFAEYVDTLETFALRKVQWVVEYYRRKNICPTRAQFLKRGAFNSSRISCKSVKDVIDKALQYLKIGEA